MIAIFDDVEQVKSLKLRERLQPEVIEDEQVGFRQCRELLRRLPSPRATRNSSSRREVRS